MQKELDDPEYWKNRSRMNFNSKKYMVVHLGINNNSFFSKSEIYYLEKTKEENLSLSQTTMYHHDSMTMKKKNVILQSIIWSIFRGDRWESMTLYKAKVKCHEKQCM